MDKWKDDLNALLEGTFAGYGGQSLLAEEMEVSRQTIYQWRTGRRAPNVINRLELRHLVRKYDY